MADQKISDFSNGGTFEVGDYVAAVRAGVNYKITFGNVAAATIGVGTGQVPTADLLGALAFLATVGAAQITDGAVGTAELADDAVTAAKIAAGAVGTPEIADDAVTAAKIAAGAVGTTEIADDAVTAAKIAIGAVGSTELATGAVDLATNKVTGLLPVANSGTGVNTLASGRFVIGQGTSPVVMSTKMTYDTSTGVVTIGENTSAQMGYLGVYCGNVQYPYNMILYETGHATSKRAALALGNHWINLTDINGDGSRNLGWYNSNLAATPLQIDIGGRVTAPLQPLFLGSRTAGNVTGAADFVASNVVTNRGSHYNTTTGIFTCPVAGDYLVSFVGGNGSAFQAALQYNGGTVVANLSQITGIITAVIACAVNDQLKIRVLSGTVTANASNTNHLSIRLLT